MSKLMIPDISNPRMTVIVLTKYDIRAIANMINVSVTTEAFRKRKCLNISVVIKPNIAPIRIETTAKIKSYSIISNGVFDVNYFP